MKNIRDKLTTYKRDTYLTEEEKSYDDSLLPVIDCEVGYSPFGCSQKMLELIKGFDFSQVARYPEMFYAKLLKPIIIERFSKANLNPANIFFGHGSFNLAERVIHKFIMPRSMLGYGPQFNEVPTEMEAAGGDYRPIPFTADFQFPLQEILSQLNAGKDSMLYLDNPNNPTGYLIPLEDIELMVQDAEKNEIIVLVDEAYGDFVPDECSAINLIRKHSNLMVIRSFSKALGLAAQRVGYMAISDALAPYYGKVDVPFEPTLISAVMASAILGDHDFINQVRRSSRTAKEKISSAFTYKGLDILPTHPDVSIFVVHQSGVNLFAQFQKMGIKVENGAVYRKTNKEINHSFIRLRVPNEKDIEEVVKRIIENNFD
ncbi:MAG: hypothetical protein A3J63_02225 [Candidatus Moranbacteria bacterium RIFCSPHIGHO2_02_FULL_40_12b]|nr:MAG: hypothetical protein A3J63_02225 [Candidatus Moranbacteria bacterium RIFCSPHIGHO2_02_FULL_40_12b]